MLIGASDEWPTSIESVEGNLLLSFAEQGDFLSIDHTGLIQYRRSYEPPEAGFGSFLRDLDDAFGVLTSVSEAGAGPGDAWKDYAYTQTPDAAGREGFSLVKFDKRTGEVAGRVWIEDRHPTYVVDPVRSVLFVEMDDDVIAAFSFPERW